MKKLKRLAKALLSSLYSVATFALYCLLVFGVGYAAFHDVLSFLIGCLVIFFGILTWIKYKELD